MNEEKEPLVLARAAHLEMVRRREAFEPRPSTLERLQAFELAEPFLRAFQAQTGTPLARYQPASQSVESSDGIERVVIYYYDHPGCRSLQVLYHEVGRQIVKTWKRGLRTDKAKRQLPATAEQYLAKRVEHRRAATEHVQPKRKRAA